MQGWLQVPEKSDGYAETCFAVQVKGQALFPKYKNNNWMLMDSKFRPEDCPGKLVLIQHEEIDDGYPDDLTIRKLEIASRHEKRGLFEVPVNTLYLHSLDGDDTITIENVEGDAINIIGVEMV